MFGVLRMAVKEVCRKIRKGIVKLQEKSPENNLCLQAHNAYFPVIYDSFAGIISIEIKGFESRDSPNDNKEQ
jgi:hypothetical protein